MGKIPAVPTLIAPKSKRGGARPGAGRKPLGPESRRHHAKSIARFEAAKRGLDGTTPLDVMLCAMRTLYEEALPTPRRKKPDMPKLKAAAELAAKAAPYVHPRLNSIESPTGKPLVVEHHQPADMIEAARMIAFALARGAHEHKKTKSALKAV